VGLDVKSIHQGIHEPLSTKSQKGGCVINHMNQYNERWRREYNQMRLGSVMSYRPSAPEAMLVEITTS
jgi:hypothetical protein